MTRASISVACGSGTLVLCHTYPDRTPILAISTSEPFCLSLAGPPDPATAASQLAFARDLHRAAGTYLKALQHHAGTCPEEHAP